MFPKNCQVRPEPISDITAFLEHLCERSELLFAPPRRPCVANLSPPPGGPRPLPHSLPWLALARPPCRPHPWLPDPASAVSLCEPLRGPGGKLSPRGEKSRERPLTARFRGRRPSSVEVLSLTTAGAGLVASVVCAWVLGARFQRPVEPFFLVLPGQRLFRVVFSFSR